MDLSRRIPLTIFSRKKILNNELQLRFLKRLSRSLANGYPLLEALETITWDITLERTANTVIISLKDGMKLDQAFETVGFHPSITSYLYFARSNGNLQMSLLKSLEMFEKRIEYKKKFEQIIRYPLFLFIIFTFLLFFLNHSILPSFIDLFQTSQDAITSIEVSMTIISLMTNLSLGTILVSTFVILFWRLRKKHIIVETQIRIYQRLPLICEFFRMQTSFLFATHLGSLLKTGLPLKDIFQILSKQQELPIISHYANQIVLELSKGNHISKVLPRFSLFEKQLTIIFQKNTDAHALEKDLANYADLLTEEMHRKIIKIFSYIQPIFFIILATFIIFIYISLMWPMYQLINTI